MKLFGLLTIATALLRHRRRISYRALQMQFGLDAAGLEALRFELVRIERVAIDEDGEVLVWAGDDRAMTVPASGSGFEPVAAAARPWAPLPPLAAFRPTPGVPRPLAPCPASPAAALEVAGVPAAAPVSDAERRPLTVMFCDLADSTALSARLGPEDLQDVIRAYQETCTGLIQAYGGFVAKYMGDGILVYFGYPKSLEKNAERAVRTGLAIVEAMGGLNAGLGRAKGIEIAVRIGIATGLVMVGEVVGEGLAQERTVIGEAPNVAARLQGVAGRNGIVIGALTKEIAGDAFVYEDLGARELKGITGLVVTWGVAGLRDAGDERVDEAETQSGAPPPTLVGRDEEVGLLRRAWQGTKDDGRGQVALISGEAGIGKSVLIDGLRAGVLAEGLPRVTFRCSPCSITRSDGLSPFAMAWRSGPRPMPAGPGPSGCSAIRIGPSSSTSLAVRRENRWSSVPRPASPVSGPSGASAGRP